jgi:hypothetical protein
VFKDKGREWKERKGTRLKELLDDVKEIGLYWTLRQ